MRLNSDIKVFKGLDVRFDASYSDVTRDLRDDGVKADLSAGTITSPGFLSLIKSPFLAPYAFDINGNSSHYLAAADDYLGKVFEADGQVYANSVRLANPKAILELGDG